MSSFMSRDNFHNGQPTKLFTSVIVICNRSLCTLAKINCDQSRRKNGLCMECVHPCVMLYLILLVVLGKFVPYVWALCYSGIRYPSLHVCLKQKGHLSGVWEVWVWPDYDNTVYTKSNNG